VCKEEHACVGASFDETILRDREQSTSHPWIQRRVRKSLLDALSLFMGQRAILFYSTLSLRLPTTKIMHLNNLKMSPFTLCLSIFVLKVHACKVVNAR